METSIIKSAKEEINKQLADTETMQSLLQTTFKGFEPQLMKRAILEGSLRGFKFQDFLQKNVYAIPFKDSYSLVTSIDYARKIGMRSGIVGKSEPVFEEQDTKIVSCKITVNRKVDDYIGDYTAKVYFNEYYKPPQYGKQTLWDTKPHTMIAKVAEMHALRQACPEEMSQLYVEEEYHKEKNGNNVDVWEWHDKLNATKSLEELKKVWSDAPVEAKEQLEKMKDQLKKKYENSKVSNKRGVATSQKGKDNGNATPKPNSKKGK